MEPQSQHIKNGVYRSELWASKERIVSMHPCFGSIILDVEAPILKRCFIAMGFNPSNNAWYDSINSIVRDFGLESYRNDKHGSDAIWMTEVMKEIARSGMVLALCKEEECQHTTASLRGPNLNVLLEMGIALALRKPMITLWSTKLEKPPSDISTLSFLLFFNEDEPPERIRGRLIEELARAKKRLDNGSSFAFGIRYLMTRQDVVTSLILLLCFVSDITDMALVREGEFRQLSENLSKLDVPELSPDLQTLQQRSINNAARFVRDIRGCISRNKCDPGSPVHDAVETLFSHSSQSLGLLPDKKIIVQNNLNSVREFVSNVGSTVDLIENNLKSFRFREARNESKKLADEMANTLVSLVTQASLFLGSVIDMIRPSK